jgi:hypothetical protein
VSDSYDPEWGTSDVRDEIATALEAMYARVSNILDNRPPKPILEVVRTDDAPRNAIVLPLDGQLTERQWRLLRFALERALESL